MIRQPPIAVPAAIVRAHTTLIQIATSNLGVWRNCNCGGRSLNAPLPVAVNRVKAIGPMAEPHKRGGGDLELAEGSIDCLRPQAAQAPDEKSHEEKSDAKTGDGGGDHGDQNFVPHPLELDDAPVAIGGGESRAAEATH